MRDMHCHILPGVDDGAQSLDESLSMLAAARKAGITQIVCTPHCRDPYFDYDAMWDAFELLKQEAGDDVALSMGFEVNIAKLCELGMHWIDHLAFDETDEFLLELETGASAGMYGFYERVIVEIQSRGYEVVIAHPERYRAVQEDPEVAQQLVRMGCKLQASSDFITGGRWSTGAEKKPAKRLFKEGLYSYIASDAHNVAHYRAFADVVRRYGAMLQ
jgi:protein-tyrosine phosphatase